MLWIDCALFVVACCLVCVVSCKCWLWFDVWCVLFWCVVASCLLFVVVMCCLPCVVCCVFLGVLVFVAWLRVGWRLLG